MQPPVQKVEPAFIPCVDAQDPDVQAGVLPGCNVSNDQGASATNVCAELKGRGSRARRTRRNRLALAQAAAVAMGRELKSTNPAAYKLCAKAQATPPVENSVQAARLPVQMFSEFHTDSTEAEGQEECNEDEEFAAKFGDLAGVADSPEQSHEIIAKLESTDRAHMQQIIKWLQGNVLMLALSKHGCRVVQKALEVADNLARDRLFAELEPHVMELCDSPHGNHVLTKLVEIMPTAGLRPIIERLQGQDPAIVARHRFGCRVLERLIEHCSEAEIGQLIDQIVAKSEMLCRHVYGNFVIQHMLEQGSPARRKFILNQLLPRLPYLAMHRTASHVVQRALAYGDQEDLYQLINALLSGKSPNSFIEVARSHYGSFVVYQLVDLRMRSPSYFNIVYHTMAKNLEELVQTDFGRKVAEHFKLEVPNANIAVGEVLTDALVEAD